jgi:endonuclease III
MKRQERYKYVLNYFQEHTPKVSTELEFASVFQLLVAVVLSAQCTDKRVNQVTPGLFSLFPDAKAMAAADEMEVYECVKSVSYPNAKARHLVQLARMVMEKYGGEVPQAFDELIKLPGVGRKTANVMQAVAFGGAAMPVDTHVYRVSHRLGLVPPSANTPLKVERILVKNIPQNLLADAHHWLLLHGRYVCMTRSPHCDECAFNAFCPKDLAKSKLA